MRLQADPKVEKAIVALSAAREAFEAAVASGLILGNDNHIGDLGEYWVREYFGAKKLFKSFAPTKNSSYDIELVDSMRVSVKTLTAWSQRGYGTQIKPLCGTNWQLLAAVYLDRSLHPQKIAVVPLEAMRSQKVFVDNAASRLNGARTYPRFQWWPWLDEYLVYSHV